MGTALGSAGVGNSVGRGVGAGDKDGDVGEEDKVGEEERVAMLGTCDGFPLVRNSVGAPLGGLTAVGRTVPRPSEGAADLKRELGDMVGLDEDGTPVGASVFPATAEGEGVGSAVVFEAVGGDVRGGAEGGPEGLALSGRGVGASTGLRVTMLGACVGNCVCFTNSVGTALGAAGVGN